MPFKGRIDPLGACASHCSAPAPTAARASSSQARPPTLGRLRCFNILFVFLGGLGLRGLGFRGLGFRGLGFRGLEFRGVVFGIMGFDRPFLGCHRAYWNGRGHDWTFEGCISL